MASRRRFIKNTVLSGAGVTLAPSLMGMPASSYRRIIGSNDRIHVGLIGLGRRLGAFYEPIARKESNVQLAYLCDVMESQRTRAMENFAQHIDYRPKLENDIRKVIDDKKVDAIINATPDHWHTPGSIMAMKGGKHVYVEKPASNTMDENELLVAAAQKYKKLVQMGNQQRSSDHSMAIINDIHQGAIGTPYKAVAFYVNQRGEVPVQKPAAVPAGLDWDLWQGPAPRRAYTSETWDYNWHWYGWDYGTAEAGNNGTHELDVARWALQVDFPERVDVQGAKRHFLDDGWEMYDTLEATYRFSQNRIIRYDSKSRNGYDTYGGGRGTIIYGSEGTVFMDRNRYRMTDREGNLLKEYDSASAEAGTALGGGGDMSTAHVVNFFEAIRGNQELQAPIIDAAKSMALVHYANLAYRVGKGFDVDSNSGRIYDRDAMRLWSREYAPGWEPQV